MRLDPAGREDHVGQLAADHLGRPVGAEEADHPGPGVHRAVDGHDRRARDRRRSRCRCRRRRGSTCRCGRPDTASARPGRPARTVAARGRRARSGYASRPMSTSSISPQRCRAGSMRWQGLSSPKVTVRVARNASPGTAPVSVATPDGRSTAIVGMAYAVAARWPAGRRRRAGPADHRCPAPRPPQGRSPVAATPRSRRSARSISRPPAARRRPRPARVRRPQAADRGDRSPAPGQPGPGEQRVTAVVARDRPRS